MATGAEEADDYSGSFSSEQIMTLGAGHTDRQSPVPTSVRLRNDVTTVQASSGSRTDDNFRYNVDQRSQPQITQLDEECTLTINTTTLTVFFSRSPHSAIVQKTSEQYFRSEAHLNVVEQSGVEQKHQHSSRSETRSEIAEQEIEHSSRSETRSESLEQVDEHSYRSETRPRVIEKKIVEHSCSHNNENSVSNQTVHQGQTAVCISEPRSSKRSQTKLILNSQPTNTINLAVIGTTGSGKSATCNSILCEDVFRSELSPSSITFKCKKKTAVLEGRTVTVVDSPGVMDTEDPVAALEEIGSLIYFCAEGLDALIMVFNIYTRLANQEKVAIEQLKTVFGTGFFAKYGILLFTHGDGVSKEDFEQYVVKFKDVIEECQNRTVLFNNKLSPEESRSQSSELLSMIEAMQVENGVKYTSELFLRARIEQEKEMEMHQNEIKELDNEKEQEISQLCIAAEEAEKETKQLEQNRLVDFKHIVEDDMMDFVLQWGCFNDITTSLTDEAFNMEAIKANIEDTFVTRLTQDVAKILAAEYSVSSLKEDSEILETEFENKMHSFRIKMHTFRMKMRTSLTTNSTKLQDELQHFEDNWKQTESQLLLELKSEWMDRKENTFQQHQLVKEEIDFNTKLMKSIAESDAMKLKAEKEIIIKIKLQEVYKQQMEILEHEAGQPNRYENGWKYLLSQCNSKMEEFKGRNLASLTTAVRELSEKIRLEMHSKSTKSIRKKLIQLRQEKDDQLKSILKDGRGHILAMRNSLEKDFEVTHLSTERDSVEEEPDLVDENMHVHVKEIHNKFKHESYEIRETIQDQTWNCAWIADKTIVEKVEHRRKCMLEKWVKQAKVHYFKEFNQKLEVVKTMDETQARMFKVQLENELSDMHTQFGKRADDMISSSKKKIRKVVSEKCEKLRQKKAIQFLTLAKRELYECENVYLPKARKILEHSSNRWITRRRDDSFVKNYTDWIPNDTENRMSVYIMLLQHRIPTEANKWMERDTKVENCRESITNMTNENEEARGMFERVKAELIKEAEYECRQKLEDATDELRKTSTESFKTLCHTQKASWKDLKTGKADMTQLNLDWTLVKEKRHAQVKDFTNELSSKYTELRQALLSKLYDKSYVLNEKMKTLQETDAQNSIKHCESSEDMPVLYDFSDVFPYAEQELQKQRKIKDEDFCRLLNIIRKKRSLIESIWLSKMEREILSVEHEAVADILSEVKFLVDFSQHFEDLIKTVTFWKKK